MAGEIDPLFAATGPVGDAAMDIAQVVGRPAL